MLQINLLPAGQRKAVRSPVEELHRAPLAWIVLGVLVLLALVPEVMVRVREQRLLELKRRIEQLEPKQAAVAQVQRVLRRLREQEVAFSGLSRGADYWSKRLNTLSNVTPEGVWFDEFRLDRQKGLVIRGSAIGEGGAEMMRVGRLVQDLKADAGFSVVVKDIQIESIKRVKDKEIEVVKFTLTCALADR